MDTRLVVATPRNDEVCKLLRGFDKLLMHGLEYLLIAVKHHIDGTSTLYHISADVADKAHVRVGINEYLQVHHVAQLLVVQGHNALQNDDGLRLYTHGFWQSVGDDIRIGRLFHGLSILEHLDMLSK